MEDLVFVVEVVHTYLVHGRLSVCCGGSPHFVLNILRARLTVGWKAIHPYGPVQKDVS